jgi:membrane-bound lytic murein transglycosylase F
MRYLLTLYLLFLLAACGQNKPETSLPDELVVVSRNAPTTWYQGKDELLGPEYELIQSFANYYKIPFRLESVDSIGEVLEWMQQGKAHIAAAGLTDTEKRRAEGFLFGPQYYEVQQQVVCRRSNGALPRKIDDLIGKNIRVIADSSYVEQLHQIKQQHPRIRWQEVDDMGTEQLLEQVWKKEVDCVLADSNIVSINRRYYPELVVAFPFSEPQPLAWIINAKWPQLNGYIEEWLNHITENGELAVIQEKYYGHVELFDYVDMRKYISRIKRSLPKYRAQFERAAIKYKLDWTMLAAQAYQESHWNAKAKSPTGVRGMMMLTLSTAKQMGVESRLDATQSIQGGAKYMARMISRIPDTVQGEDRIWMALAAYNVGFGHLSDALSLASEMNKKPDYWVDVKQILPLLSQKKIYKKLKHGYARGREPVEYVQRIRDYQQVLIQQLKILPVN